MKKHTHESLLEESSKIMVDLLNESRKGASGSAKAKAQEYDSDYRKAGWNDPTEGGSHQAKKKKLAKKLPIANDGKPSGTDEIGKHDAS